MKRNKFKILIILIGIILLIPFTVTLSKYIYDFAKDYVMEANHFYFNSDKLEAGGIDYALNNWSGVSGFSIQFTLNNTKNNILVSNSDVSYNVSLSCSDDVTCTINSTSGVIYVSEHTDYFTINVNPRRVFDTDESVVVNVSATSTAPYVKTISATFTITVGRKGLSYEISDEANQPYMNFIITNAVDEYFAIEDYGSYHEGDTILTEEYINMSAAEKAHFASAVITLTFDPTLLLLDTTNSIMNGATFTYTNVDGVNFISSITFKIDATSAVEVGFYKKNQSADYTYPFVNETSIVGFSAVN